MTSNNTQNSKSSRIDVNQSPIMNEDEMQLFLNVRRSRSDESMIGRLFSQPIEAQKSRPLIITIPTAVAESTGNSGMGSFKLFRKIKKEKKKNQSDYCKNICGYITKKIIRELCSPNYASHVKSLCNKHKCQYQQIKTFYLPKIQQVTGPSHIPGLLVAQGQQEERIKQVFREFFEWFIKYRYLRYLLIEGKMADKKAYIKYKNYMLLAMLREKKGTQQENIDEEQGDESMESVSQEQSEEEEDEQEEQKTPEPVVKKNGRNSKNGTAKPTGRGLKGTKQ